jgi:hypothetical protein
MMQNIQQELVALESMTATQLRSRYRELFGEDSRSGNRRWLFRRCAWRVQALAEGNLAERIERIRAQATQLANDADLRVVAPREPTPDPSAPRQIVKVALRQEDRLPLPGTVIERPFKGRRHVVKVLGDGFEYNNRIYKSLSAVAHAISGSHWNGFHFFREQLNYAKREEARHG